MYFVSGSRILAGGGEWKDMKHRRLLILSLLVVALLVGGCGLWVWQAKRQYALNRELIAALLHGDSKQSLVLVEQGADPNTREEPTPAPSFKLLLDQFLNPSPPVNNSPTALMFACGVIPDLTKERSFPLVPLAENLLLIQAMLTHGANVHARYGEMTALQDAADAGRWHTVELLLQHGADATCQGELGTTPLRTAISKDSISAVRLLLAHGANPNVQDGEGKAALHYTLFMFMPNAKNVIVELMGYGADPNLADKNGVTPLQYAQARPDVVALLQNGAK